MGRRIDLTGQKFGRLIVLNECITDKNGRCVWKCRCDCGHTTTVSSGNLRSGHTQSCGCLWKETVPGANKFDCMYDSNSRLYKIWTHMKERCTNPCDKDYKHYGKRGISICKEWQGSFADFVSWAIANGYEDNLTIDRINVDDGYYPENCRWVSMKVQENNKTDNRTLNLDGKIKTLSQWSDITGISTSTLSARLNKLGWTIERTLTTPVRNINRRQK